MTSAMEWLKLKVTKNLNATEAAFEDLMDQEAPTGATNRQLLDSFLEREDQNEELLLFYATEHQAADGRALACTLCSLEVLNSVSF